jgi:hypothetical protein
MMKEIIKEYLSKVDLMKSLVGFTIMGIFFILVNALIVREMPEGNREIVIHILGIIEGAVMTIVNFYYGSSKGSQKKNDTIDKMTDTK